MTVFSEPQNLGDLPDVEVVWIKTASDNLGFVVGSLYDHPENRHGFSEIIWVAFKFSFLPAYQDLQGKGSEQSIRLATAEEFRGAEMTVIPLQG